MPGAALLHIYSSFDISDARSNFVAYIMKASYYIITFQSSLSLSLSIQVSSNALLFFCIF